MYATKTFAARLLMLLAVSPQAALAQTSESPSAEPQAIELQQAGETPGPMVAELNHPSGQYQEGDLLRVRLRTTHPLHVYVLYHQNDGQAVLVFPNTGRRDSRVAAGDHHEFPAQDDEVQCIVRGPFDREAVQVVASQTPIEGFEEALKASEESVPVMPTEAVDAVCQAHAEQVGLVSQTMIVTAPAQE